MACYVTSDIHGCYEQFIRLLHKISFGPDDTLYILGDIIDRGPDSVDMIKWILQAPQNVHFMLGNHEQMMLDDTTGDYRTMSIAPDSTWDINGGAETARQMMYGLSMSERQMFFNMCRNANVCEIIRVNGRMFILTHAGLVLEPDMTVDNMMQYQDAFSLLWARDEWFCSDTVPPALTVFGHTPTDIIVRKARKFGSPRLKPSQLNAPLGSILMFNNRIAIDGGCYFGHRLNCIRLDDGKQFWVPGPQQHIDEFALL